MKALKNDSYLVFFCLWFLQGGREDQDPGEESERPDRGELHGTEHRRLSAGQTPDLILNITLILFISTQS